MTTTVSVPLLPLALLGGWASASTFLWVAGWWRCARWHCGIVADADLLVAWDEPPDQPARERAT